MGRKLSGQHFVIVDNAGRGYVGLVVMASDNQIEWIKSLLKKRNLSWEDVLWNMQNNLDLPKSMRIQRIKYLSINELWNKEVESVMHYLSNVEEKE
ncbi:MAG: hypothetical protein FJ241_12175 [Nitrospira sp.]|nr:hypothetical protein [Nitrospira sp.]